MLQYTGSDGVSSSFLSNMSAGTRQFAAVMRESMIEPSLSQARSWFPLEDSFDSHGTPEPICCVVGRDLKILLHFH